jgi:hypothetical protein
MKSLVSIAIPAVFTAILDPGAARADPGGEEPPAPVTAPAPVYTPPAPSARDAPAAEDPPRYDLVRVNAGLRVGYVPNRAFDTFADSDVLSQFSLDGTYPLLTRGRLVLAAGLGWNVGSRSDGFRGHTSSLTAHHLYVPLEARYHVRPWIYGFAKLSPGAAAMIATAYDGTTPGEMSTTGWAFSADASAGASFLIGPRKQLDRRGRVRFWLTPEVGYNYTTNAPLAVNAGRDEKDVLGADEDTRLRSLALSGFFWRASVGATF